jgi:hypothetical protein
MSNGGPNPVAPPSECISKAAIDEKPEGEPSRPKCQTPQEVVIANVTAEVVIEMTNGEYVYWKG